ncbi:uncharacterized protein [Amphiura filiformis]|uniref:uncharacterized protein n=1 Tax=Amphiura filiformis TaxID=82378 RepID=UPI003B213B36
MAAGCRHINNMQITHMLQLLLLLWCTPYTHQEMFHQSSLAPDAQRMNDIMVPPTQQAMQCMAIPGPAIAAAATVFASTLDSSMPPQHITPGPTSNGNISDVPQASYFHTYC